MNLFDYTDPQPRAPRLSAYDRARLLFELADTQANPAVAPNASVADGRVKFAAPDGSGMKLSLPQAPRTATDDVDLYAAAAKAAGRQAPSLVGNLGDFLRDRALQREIPTLASPEQRIAAWENKDVAPVNLSGGVAFDRFSRETPILGESSAVGALADQRRAGVDKAQADASNARASAGEHSARAANLRAAGPSQRVKAKLPTGEVGYFDTFIGPDGTTHYRPATGPDGSALQVAPDSTDGPTAFQQNTTWEAKTRGISEKEVLEQSRKSGVTPALVRDVEQELLSGRDRSKYLSDPTTLRTAIDDRVNFYVGIANQRAGIAPEDSAGPAPLDESPGVSRRAAPAAPPAAAAAPARTAAPDLDDSAAGAASDDARQTNAVDEAARIAQLRQTARRVKTVDEARALPAGTPFIDPQGVLRTR